MLSLSQQKMIPDTRMCLKYLFVLFRLLPQGLLTVDYKSGYIFHSLSIKLYLITLIGGSFVVATGSNVMDEP